MKRYVKLAIFLLVGCLLLEQGLLAQPRRTPTQKERQENPEAGIAIIPEETAAALLAELSCTPVSQPVVGFSCAALPDFEVGAWTHPDLDSFAAKYGEVHEKLSAEGFELCLQGIADSHRPTGRFTWEDQVNGKRHGGEYCNKGSGKLQNIDFAWLRSCTLRNAIQSKYGRAVTVLPPKAFQPTDNRRTGQDRAVLVFLVEEAVGDTDGQAQAQEI